MISAESKKLCPNCRNKCDIDEQINYCIKCGFIFINMIKRMPYGETEERSHTRRTGEGVDLVDG